MKPSQKLADIKKNPATRNPSSKGKNSLQRTSPYGLVSAVPKAKHQRQQVSEDLAFRPIMVTFIPSANSEITLKPDYPVQF
ncbi:hypothetical protein SteCoe_19839 [Stentor coeruleus]|jgi:hypothetical protein|uniref:Uncharacterized protein n=1 Tax=Stentor coeruleus TaxID=5963 RepID=A0A1R2BTD9_9CILI|nr:hypothetical protein SteCoe_19839 [Stentor coeruleus]